MAHTGEKGSVLEEINRPLQRRTLDAIILKWILSKYNWIHVVQDKDELRSFVMKLGAALNAVKNLTAAFQGFCSLQLQ